MGDRDGKQTLLWKEAAQIWMEFQTGTVDLSVDNDLLLEEWQDKQ